MALLPADIEYFKFGERENPDFWTRFGGKPDFKGKTALDLGCGHGSLCVDIAESGAAKVVGIDLYEPRIEFAKEYTKLHYPYLVDNLEFVCQDLKDYPLVQFDYMVSKYTFEHVIGLLDVLKEMKKRLKPGGRLYTGFGPLYSSPWGDHGRTLSLIPWGHCVQPEAFIVKRINSLRKPHEKIESVYDLGLNMLAPAEYRRIFDESGLKTHFYVENMVMPSAGTARKAFGSLLSLGRKVPFLEKYCTVNIFCVLENPDVAPQRQTTPERTAELQGAAVP